MARFRTQSLFGGALIALFFALNNLPTAITSAEEQSGDVKQEAAQMLIGTWKLETSKTPGTPSGIGTRLRIFNGTHWCVIQPDDAGKIIFLHGGTYEFDGSELKAKTDFAGARTESFIGTKGTFKLEIEADVLTQIDPNGVFDETWSRIRNPDVK